MLSDKVNKYYWATHYIVLFLNNCHVYAFCIKIINFIYWKFRDVAQTRDTITIHQVTHRVGGVSTAKGKLCDVDSSMFPLVLLSVLGDVQFAYFCVEKSNFFPKSGPSIRSFYRGKRTQKYYLIYYFGYSSYQKHSQLVNCC